jgi:hypothetical protein
MDELSIPKENAMARLLRLRETLRNNREQNSDATSNISEPIAAVNPLPIPISTDCSDGKGLPVEQCARVPIMPAGDASGAPFTEKYETPENGFREGAIVHEVSPGALKWTHGQEEAEAAELQNGGETVQPMPASDDEYSPAQSVEKVVALSQGDSVPKAEAGHPSTELEGGTDRKRDRTVTHETRVLRGRKKQLKSRLPHVQNWRTLTVRRQAPARLRRKSLTMGK